MIKEYHAGDEGSGTCGEKSAPPNKDALYLKAIFVIAASTLEIANDGTLGKVARVDAMEGALAVIFVALDKYLDAFDLELEEKLTKRVAELKRKVASGELPG